MQKHCYNKIIGVNEASKREGALNSVGMGLHKNCPNY